MNKICKKCGESKPQNDFEKPSSKHCITCLKAKKHEIYLRNREQTAIRRKEKYYSDLDNTRKKNREYYQANKDKFNLAASKYKKKKRKTDPTWKLIQNIRSNIGRVFHDRNITKKSKTFDILGCSKSEFKEYIESKFEPWMSWDNYGARTHQIKELNQYWDIDHIIPISTIKTEDDAYRLNHYTNLQPLCSYKNRFIKPHEKK